MREIMGLVAVCVLFFMNVASANIDGMQSCKAVSEETCKVAHDLKRGINMGNMLEAPNEGDWGVRLDPAYIKLIEGKFDTVRVPIRWSNHASKDSKAIIDEFFFKRVERVVDSLLEKGFYVIINMHHYSQLNGGALGRNEFSVEEDVVEARFLNMWSQISKRFKNKSSKLLFEILNEPHAKLTSERWNKLLVQATDVIRVENPRRVLLIGPAYWNNIRDLPKLKLPENDRNIIVSIHNYSPFNFTHQGLSWMPHLKRGVVCCNSQQKKGVIRELDQAVSWNKRMGYPLHLGEFGSNQNADMVSRANYTRFIREALDERHIGWAYWEFASIYGVYDPKKKQWRAPLVDALLY